jgi:ATP/maltotriose-dependent transcriptional regulator MalT
MFNKSKFCIPEKDTGIFISERIETLQKHMSEYDAVTICAPAGYGKSTLAAIYASNLIKSKYKTCWYRIEKQDAELSIFFSNLIYSVFYKETTADVLLSYLTNQTEIEEKKYYLAAQFCRLYGNWKALYNK